jgi:hypothetical protein
MADAVRTIVTFRSSAFNTTESKDYFINPYCFGDDLARWLIQRLRSQGITTDDEPGQEDFGWYFNFRIGDARYCLVLGWRPEDDAESGTWMGVIERNLGLIASLLGRRSRGLEREASLAVHLALADAPEIGEVRWHLKKEFDALREELGVPEP